MSNFKKDLACNITLIVVLAFAFIHLLVLTLGIFGCITFSLPDNFSYILAYFLVVISLALYVLSFFVTKLKRMWIPPWFRILFYVAFFLFTNTYYIIGGYYNVVTIILFFIYVSFLVTVMSVSVFYHTQKDEKNRLKTSKNYILTSVFFYAVGTNAIIELIVSAIKSFLLPNYLYTTLNMCIVEMATMILTTIVMLFFFSLSLSRSKKFINACLIKFYKPKSVAK